MANLHIRELREAAGYTQAELAKGVGVTSVMVCQWESGKKTPQAAKLPKLADLLNCTIDQIFGRDTTN